MLNPNKAPASVITSRGCESENRSHVAPNIFLRIFIKNPSSYFLSALGFSKKELSTGITVSETKNDAAILSMVAMAIGANNRPSTPVNPSRGRKTRMINRVAYKMDDRTSAEADAITSNLGRGGVRDAFSDSLRNTFSTSTIASSTTIPMATASPPNVIELTLRLNRSKTRMVIPQREGNSR